MDSAVTLDRSQLGPDDKARIVRILRSHSVARATFFGSYARGDQRATSDVDLLMEPPRGDTLIDRDVVWNATQKDLLTLEQQAHVMLRNMEQGSGS